MLFKTNVLDEQENEVLARIDEVRTTLSYAVTARRWTGSIRRMVQAQAVQGSNSIEGIHVTVDDAIGNVGFQVGHAADGYSHCDARIGGGDP